MGQITHRHRVENFIGVSTKAHAQIETNVEAGAQESYEIRPEGQQRHHHHHRHQGWSHEKAYRIDTHDAQCVDLLVDGHGTEARRKRSARASGDQDTGNERRELPGDGERYAERDAGFRTEEP